MGETVVTIDSSTIQTVWAGSLRQRRDAMDNKEEKTTETLLGEVSILAKAVEDKVRFIGQGNIADSVKQSVVEVAKEVAGALSDISEALAVLGGTSDDNS